MNPFRLTVPGNLLLAGEYAVLEEGGLGIGLAVEPRVIVTVTPSDRWQIVGRWAAGTDTWHPEQAGEPPFAGQVFFEALRRLEDRGDARGRRWDRRIPEAIIEIDSSAFFDARGRKRGFGSSAALAAGITAALAGLQGRQEEVHQIAVAAHRRAQGGAGSGYDVTASWFGGLGLFTGGPEPRWTPITPALPPLAVFSGPEAVRTVGSIAQYQAWKATDPGTARNFLEQSNAAVYEWATASGWEALRRAWEQTRLLGIDLGGRVGSPADLEPPPGLPSSLFIKALGAGNETGLVAGPELPPSLPSGVQTIIPSREGIRWE